MAEEQNEPVGPLISKVAENIRNENMFLAGQNFAKAQSSMRFSPEASTSFFPKILIRRRQIE